MKNSIARFKVILTIFAGIQLIFAGVMFFVTGDEGIKTAAIGYGGFNVIFIFVILTLIVFENKRRLIATSKVIGQEAAEAFKFAGVGLILLDSKHQTIWTSESVLSKQAATIGTSVFSWLPEFSRLLQDPTKEIFHEVDGRTLRIRYLKETRTLIIHDWSQIAQLETTYKGESTVFGFIKVDNYQQLTANAPEETALNINVAVRGGITAWAKQFGLFVKSYAQDGFVIVTDSFTFDKILQDTFKFMDQVKEECAKNNLEVTLSLGFAKGTSNIQKLTELANEAIERAEARGGDQVVINTYGDEIVYLGGNTEAVAKVSRTEIKQLSKKIVAQMQNAQRIIIMGHQYGDYDSVASGLALASIASSLGKEAYVVVDFTKLDIKAKRNIEPFMGKEYIKERCISPSEAMKYITDDLLVIVVDTTVPSRVEAPELLEVPGVKVVVLDHHRKGGSVIENAELEYVDAAASSTSEIVAELLEFYNVDNPLTENEVNLLLTGIVVDTNNFKSTRVGPRTFHASWILKTWGANQLIADELLKDTYEEYKLKADVISNATKITEKIVLARVPEKMTVHTSMLAQIAQQILEIAGVQAAFVIGKNNPSTTAISARSNGEVNVQVIMEKLKGGGHFNAAATQREDISMEELEEQLIKVMKKI